MRRAAARTDCRLHRIRVISLTSQLYLKMSSTTTMSILRNCVRFSQASNANAYDTRTAAVGG